ncbi:IgGFc-binding protein-like [Haliotis rufescens]|uniref:IgGFc-binding protein-like n=1 Tax=Haliotis rufescens TaxID=6454 RepID=UPI00201F9F2B|nr:IgGFc-binding protein-like [Haliotis rufescens]
MNYKYFRLVVLLTVLQSGKGEDYVVALAYRGKYSYIRYTAGETGGLMEIQYPHFAYRTSSEVGPFNGGSRSVTDKMKITSVVENTAVVVSGSDEDVNILVEADGLFSPFPVSVLGTKYFVPSSLAPNSYYRSLLLIITHNMSTDVKLLFQMGKGSVYFVNYEYGDGDTLSIKLDPYQTLMINTPHDLNGTVINSEHNVAVYSGIDYASKYTVYDQLLPVKHHGQEYVVAVDDTKLELQIISEHSHVHITFSTGATVSTGERRLYNRSLQLGESLHFTTTHPVLVTLNNNCEDSESVD